MRIGIVSPVVVGFGKTPDTYSSQQINLALRWADLGHSVDLFTLRGQGLESADFGPAVNVYLCNGVMMGSTGLPLMHGVRAAVRDGNYDFVLSSENYHPATALASLVSSRVLVYQGQSSSGASFRNKIVLGTLEATCGEITRRHSLGVVAKTTAAARYASERGFQQVEVIPCGYDETRFRAPSADERAMCRSSLELPTDAYVITYAGNLLPRRDVGAVIEAMAILKARHSEVRFLIVGEGPELETLKSQAAQLGVDGQVSFLGLFPWSELRKVYWASDVFVFPSHYEIFGLVVLEAMASGLVVVSTGVGAAADVIKSAENGYLVAIGSPREIADTIDRLGHDFLLRQRMRTRALADIQDYTWRAISQRILDYYERLIT